MGEVKQINVKSRTYYFYKDIISIKDFDAELLKIDKSSYKNIGIYNIGYITKKKIDVYENIYSVNPLYLSIDHASGSIKEKKLNPWYLHIDHVSGYVKEEGVNKYLVFDSTDQNKKLLKRYNNVLNGINNKIKEVSDSGFDYEKDYMKIKFNSTDNLPLNKPLKFHLMTITLTYVFEEDGKLYPQVYLDYSLYELHLQEKIPVMFFINLFGEYIKLSEISDSTYYKKTRDLILNKKHITIKIIKRG